MNKVAAILKKLLEQSRRNSADWKIGTNDNEYILHFPKHSIGIRGYGDDYWISLYDNFGTEMDVASDVELLREYNQAHKDLAELYALARRKARGVDAALDDILGELDA